MRDDVSDYLLKEPQEPTLPGDGLSGGSESPLPVLNATPSALPIHPDEPDVSAASIAAALSFEAGVQAQTEPRLFHNYALSGKLYESSLGGNSRKLSFVEALSQCAVPLPNKPHTHNDARLEAAWRAGDEDAFKERLRELAPKMTAPYVKMLTAHWVRMRKGDLVITRDRPVSEFALGVLTTDTHEWLSEEFVKSEERDYPGSMGPIGVRRVKWLRRGAWKDPNRRPVLTPYVCGIFNGLQACTVNELTDVDKQGEVLRGLMANSRPL